MSVGLTVHPAQPRWGRDGQGQSYDCFSLPAADFGSRAGFVGIVPASAIKTDLGDDSNYQPHPEMKLVLEGPWVSLEGQRPGCQEAGPCGDHGRGAPGRFVCSQETSAGRVTGGPPCVHRPAKSMRSFGTALLLPESGSQGRRLTSGLFSCNFPFPRESLVPALARLPSGGRHRVRWPGLRSRWLCASLLWASLSNS